MRQQSPISPFPPVSANANTHRINLMPLRRFGVEVQVYIEIYYLIYFILIIEFFVLIRIVRLFRNSPPPFHPFCLTNGGGAH